MPAAHDVYAEQLSELRRGEPLYYPEPHPQDGPIEIGDLGFMKEGAFYRLLNVAKACNDPAQLFGVPDAFERLDMGVIRQFEAALEPGPLHSRTVSTVEADIGTQSGMLPAEASFRFKCASKRGAILMLESGMIREEAIQSSRFENYLRRHCTSFVDFAKSHDISLGFGDLMLITGTSKTAAWSSVVYSNSCKEFGLAFSVGNPFLPSGVGVSASSGLERTGPVERRRSRQRALPENAPLPNNHTVFVKAYRLGTREAYYQSMVSIFVKTFDPKSRERSVNGRTKIAELGIEGVTSPSTRTTEPPSPLSHTDFQAMIMRPEGPDFHPALPFLGIAMETSDSECVVIHDDDWCSSANPETSLLIEKYADFHFDDGSGSLLSAMANVPVDLEVETSQTQLELFSMRPNLKRDTLRDSDDTTSTVRPSTIEHALREAFTKFISSHPSGSNDLNKDQNPPSDYISTKGQLPHSKQLSIISRNRGPVTTTATSLPTLEIENSLIVRDIVIALVGPTGAGKSHFINIATRQPSVVVGDDFESCTQSVQAVRYPHPDGSGRSIIFVDTPGFDDAEGMDYQVLRQIAHWMKKTYSEHVTLSGILFFHRITDVRMRGTSLRSLAMLEALCGKDALQNVVLTTTGWDMVSPELGPAREAKLIEKFWAPALGQGCRMARFRNTFASAWEITDLLCETPRRALLIQREMVDETKKLEATTAFSVLVRWWEQVISKFKRKVSSEEG